MLTTKDEAGFDLQVVDRGTVLLNCKAIAASAGSCGKNSDS